MKPRFLIAVCAFAVVAALSYKRLHLAFDPPRPNDMPASARFVDARYDLEQNERKGFWVACRTGIKLDSVDPKADWCRVTDQDGTVIYEGQFLPVDSPQPVEQSELQLAPLADDRLWIKGPVEELPVPAIPLKDGKILVPENDRRLIQSQWASNSDPASRYLPVSEN